MDLIKELLSYLSAEKLQVLLEQWGYHAYWLTGAIVFAETGLLVGFFLPGDSLLFVTGFVASIGSLNLVLCWLVLGLAAVIGDQLGFVWGRWTGKRIWERPDSLLFKRKYLEQTQAFYQKYGKSTIILARFVPIVRTFAPFMAGVGRMEYRTFVLYNVVGGVAWVVSMTSLGYFLGQIEWLKKHLDIAVILVVFLSILPMVIEVSRAKWVARRETAKAP